MLPGSLRPAAGLLPGVPRGTDGTAGAGGFRDGLTGHLAVVPKPVGAGRAREVSASSVVLLPHTSASVLAARSQISTDLHEAGIVSPAIGDATLVVSELLTNAILHARPLPGARVLVAWALRERSLEVAVSDGGAMTRPRTTRPSLSSIGGRGLTIVENLSWRWGVLPNDFGLTVWAVLPAPGGDRAGYGGLAGYSGGLVGYGGGCRGGYDYSGGAARQQA